MPANVEIGSRWVYFAIVASVVAGSTAPARADQRLACQACHLSINPASETPHLVGQRKSYLVNQLKAFKSGDRKSELMSAIATQLSDAEIEALATYWSSQPPGSDATVPPAVTRIQRSKMAFPQGFPTGFVVYNTKFSAEDNSVTRSYANAVAVGAARAGKPLPDGSVIMVVGYAAKLDAANQPIRGADGSYAVDKATSYSGMEATAGWGKDVPELLRNANWNYGLFGLDKRPRTEVNQAACLACHKPAASASYVFTLKALQAAARSK